MGRLIILALLVLIVVWAIRRAFARDDRSGAKPPRVGALVRCAHCGVHLPAGESRTAGGLPYCSEEHARLGPGADA